jgi:DNA repair protein RecN (Recombination protein N)
VLAELRVCNLGVIEDLHVELDEGMTVLTGETGAGKTLVVEALGLLLGGRADPVLVRRGAKEAIVEARFVAGGAERTLARAITAAGRSRAWVDGRMAPLATLAEVGRELVDLHGQHEHQSLSRPAVQRQALDGFARADVGPVARARARIASLERERQALGGDARALAREADALSFALREIEGARIDGPDEDERLAEEQERLAALARGRESLVQARAALVGPDEENQALHAPSSGSGGAGTQRLASFGHGATALVGEALRAVRGLEGFERLVERLAGLQGELDDVADELRRALAHADDVAGRLEAVAERRRLLRSLMRKYGEDLEGVLAYAEFARKRLEQIGRSSERAEELEAELEAARAELEAARARLGEARRQAAARFAAEVTARLSELAMAHARLEVDPGVDLAADDLSFGLAGSPNEPALPLAKVASGGELARVMLAIRLVLADVELDGPGTLVFDEVDAGVGGEAAAALGRALRRVARGRQVVVVTHVPQVAAQAHRHFAIRKELDRHNGAGAWVARIEELDHGSRVVELARMLAGRPDSSAARRHAEELLASERS